MSSFMWKKTVRNVCRAFKEVNGIECEGDYQLADFGRSLFAIRNHQLSKLY